LVSSRPASLPTWNATACKDKWFKQHVLNALWQIYQVTCSLSEDQDSKEGEIKLKCAAAIPEEFRMTCVSSTIHWPARGVNYFFSSKFWSKTILLGLVIFSLTRSQNPSANTEPLQRCLKQVTGNTIAPSEIEAFYFTFPVLIHPKPTTFSCSGGFLRGPKLGTEKVSKSEARVRSRSPDTNQHRCNQLQFKIIKI
jgi:hypothetical protein